MTKTKVLGAMLTASAFIAFGFSWDTLVELYYLVSYLPEPGLERYMPIVGQGLLYFAFSITVFVCGILFLFTKDRRKLRLGRAALFVILVIWIALEVPIYKCDFYNRGHSFWSSKRVHFH